MRSRRRLVLIAALAVGLVGYGVAQATVGGHGNRAASAGGSTHAGHAGGAPATLGGHPVAGHFKPDATKLADCASDDTSGCYEQAFGNLVILDGPKPALIEFAKDMQSNTTVQADCHRIAHMMGSAALVRFNGDVSKAFALGASTCWSGWYHGILERAFADVGSKADAGAVSRKLCSGQTIQRTQYLYYQCVHGLGHGLMIFSGYDLPWALHVCDDLKTDWDQTSCTGGVFMENISSSYGVKSRWVKDDDPVYPCETVSEKHKLYCYLMVTSRVNQLNGFNWRKTAATCRSVEKDWIETCFESLGRDASGFTRENPPQIAGICSAAKPYIVSCLYGAVRDLASFDPRGERAARLCSLVGSRFKAQCYNGIGTIVGTYYAQASQKRAACKRLAPEAYRESCVAGAGLGGTA